MRCIIIAAGSLGAITREEIAPAPEDFIICCDAGYVHAKALGLIPNLVMGDFDSYCGQLPSEVETLRFEKDKDDTDTLLAVRYGLDHGYRDFLLVAGAGGRLDHTYANLQVLAYLLENGATAELLGGSERIRLLRNGTVTLKRLEGHTLSVFAYGGVATGVMERGVYFPLTDATLTTAYPLGVSNRIVEDSATIAVKNGTLLIMQCRDDDVLAKH